MLVAIHINDWVLILRNGNERSYYAFMLYVLLCTSKYANIICLCVSFGVEVSSQCQWFKSFLGSPSSAVDPYKIVIYTS